MSDAIGMDHLAAIRRGQLAIRESLSRFGAAFAPVADVDKAYIACTEATMWIQRLDLLLHELDVETYRRRRDEDARGCVITGLRWARNRYVHDVASILIVSPDGRHLGIKRPIHEPFYGGRMIATWRLRADVPKEAYRKDRRAEEAYDRFVAGKPIADTLAAAASFLWERGLADSFSEVFPDWG